jgi:hypothetical protein
MNRTADLNAALNFVAGRMNEEAALLGEPLNVQQRLLLANLPLSRPVIWIPSPETPEPTLVPRDVNYERLCALAKAAHLSDCQMNPASLNWEFAFAVFRLNRHPMRGLLQQAGVKWRRPKWDGILLVLAALLFVASAVALAFFVGLDDAPWTSLQWGKFAFGYSAILVFMYFVSRRIQGTRLQKEIERCRVADSLPARPHADYH